MQAFRQLSLKFHLPVTALSQLFTQAWETLFKTLARFLQIKLPGEAKSIDFTAKMPTIAASRNMLVRRWTKNEQFWCNKRGNIRGKWN
jgi:hypothetical protein